MMLLSIINTFTEEAFKGNPAAVCFFYEEIGTIFLGEPFTIYLLVGIVLIVASIYLVNKKPSHPAKINESDINQKHSSA